MSTEHGVFHEDVVVVDLVVVVVVCFPVDDGLEGAVVIASAFGVADCLKFDGGPQGNRVERMDHHVGLIGKGGGEFW